MVTPFLYQKRGPITKKSYRREMAIGLLSAYMLGIASSLNAQNQLFILICLVKEFYAVSILLILFYTYNVNMM